MKALRTLYLIAGIQLTPLANGEYTNTTPETEALVSRSHKMDTQAMEQLGDIYAKGKGVEKDLDEAMNWYTNAARNGNMSANKKLWKLEGHAARKVKFIEREFDDEATHDLQAYLYLTHKFLISQGVDPSASIENRYIINGKYRAATIGDTALLMATRNKNVRSMNALIKGKADLNYIWKGGTVLDKAVKDKGTVSPPAATYRKELARLLKLSKTPKKTKAGIVTTHTPMQRISVLPTCRNWPTPKPQQSFPTALRNTGILPDRVQLFSGSLLKLWVKFASNPSTKKGHPVSLRMALSSDFFTLT